MTTMPFASPPHTLPLFIPSLFSPPNRRRSNPSLPSPHRRCSSISGTFWSDSESTVRNIRWRRAAAGNPGLIMVSRLGSNEQGFLLLAFLVFTASVAFVSFVITAIPTLKAMRRAAIAFSRLADAASDEIPSTMAAIRLSSMEISDLILELNELSQEISEGITKSAHAVQAAKFGVRQIGSLAHQRTISMIQERAELPEIPIKPVVSGAARKTSQAIVHGAKVVINLIYHGEFSSKNEDGGSVDRD